MNDDISDFQNTHSKPAAALTDGQRDSGGCHFGIPNTESHPDPVGDEWKTNELFNRAVGWCQCPFLFDHVFDDDERRRIWYSAYTNHPGVMSSSHYGRIQLAVFDTIETLGYRLSNM